MQPKKYRCNKLCRTYWLGSSRRGELIGGQSFDSPWTACNHCRRDLLLGNAHRNLLVCINNYQSQKLLRELRMGGVTWVEILDMCLEVVSPYGRNHFGICGLNAKLANYRHVSARCSFWTFESRCVYNTGELGTSRSNLGCPTLIGQSHGTISLGCRFTTCPTWERAYLHIARLA
jgi:hypothetical protein